MSLDHRLLNLLISYESLIKSGVDRNGTRLSHFTGAAGCVKASHLATRPTVERIARYFGTRLIKEHLEFPLNDSYESQLNVCRVTGKRGSFFTPLPKLDQSLFQTDSLRSNGSRLKSLVERGLASGKSCIHFCFIESSSQIVKNRDGIDVSFDIRRDLERDIAFHFKQRIKLSSPKTSVNFNIPYLNKLSSSDHRLRQIFSHGEYLALKIMVSPDFIADMGVKAVFDLLRSGMGEAIDRASKVENRR